MNAQFEEYPAVFKAIRRQLEYRLALLDGRSSDDWYYDFQLAVEDYKAERRRIFAEWDIKLTELETDDQLRREAESISSTMPSLPHRQDITVANFPVLRPSNTVTLKSWPKIAKVIENLPLEQLTYCLYRLIYRLIATLTPY